MVRGNRAIFMTARHGREATVSARQESGPQPRTAIVRHSEVVWQEAASEFSRTRRSEYVRVPETFEDPRPRSSVPRTGAW